MIDNDLVRKSLIYLEEIGWSELIDSRWEKDVINTINEKFPEINEETLNYILKIILV
jgi:hypothetical protein